MSDLGTRTGLPPDLLVLRDGLPREGWEGHANFSELTRFWLDRHLMFRDVLQRLRVGSAAYLDGDKDLMQHARETQHYAGFLLNQLHGHHQIEDHHYFPQLMHLDRRLTRGFDILDKDHEALNGHIYGLAEQTNLFLKALETDDVRERAAGLSETLAGFDVFLDRHLTDEEDLIVPVILTYAPPIG